MTREDSQEAPPTVSLQHTVVSSCLVGVFSGPALLAQRLDRGLEEASDESDDDRALLVLHGESMAFPS